MTRSGHAPSRITRDADASLPTCCSRGAHEPPCSPRARRRPRARARRDDAGAHRRAGPRRSAVQRPPRADGTVGSRDDRRHRVRRRDARRGRADPGQRRLQPQQPHRVVLVHDRPHPHGPARDHGRRHGPGALLRPGDGCHLRQPHRGGVQRRHRDQPGQLLLAAGDPADGRHDVLRASGHLLGQPGLHRRADLRAGGAGQRQPRCRGATGRRHCGQQRGRDPRGW